jgi:hypothetical protein
MAFRSRTEFVDDLFVSTYSKAQAEVRDQVFNSQNSAFWAILKSKGGMVSKTGGDNIKINLEVSKNENLQWVNKGETVTLEDFQHLERAQYEWVYATLPIVRFWHDDQQNYGEDALIDMVTSKIRNSMSSFAEALEVLLFADNVGDTKSIQGLQHLVADDPTASRVVGELDQSTNTWWRNETLDFNTTHTGQTDALWLANGVNDMRTMIQDCQHKTDIIVTSQHMFNLLQQDVLSYFQFDGRLAADLGLPTNTPMFDGIPVMWSRQCGNRMYFLDMDEIKFYYDPRFFLSLGEWLPIPNQPNDRVAHITLACSFVAKSRRTHGVIFALPS